jgi:archaellum biogenesis protein FlaJ (TadC family)
MIPELIDSVSFLLFTCILYFLSVLSKRFGNVMGMKKYYYLYYAGIFFTISGSVIMILPAPLIEFQELFGYVFFSIGLTLGLIASIKYWGWLIKEIIKG